MDIYFSFSNLRWDIFVQSKQHKDLFFQRQVFFINKGFLVLIFSGGFISRHPNHTITFQSKKKFAFKIFSFTNAVEVNVFLSQSKFIDQTSHQKTKQRRKLNMRKCWLN